MLDIIVVEDKMHFRDQAEMLGDVRIVADLLEFETEFFKKKPDLVLSDLYFPFGKKCERSRIYKKEILGLLEEYKDNGLYNEFRDDKTILPLGYFINQMCLDYSIPCAIVTTEHKDGVRCKPFSKNFEFSYHGLNKMKKKWAYAFIAIVEKYF
ncbi:hypothetical protein ACFL1H_07020 [Nanoarchaeota archaeon]